jgi:cell division protein FtsB
MLWQSKDRLEISQQRLEKAQAENQKLKSELENTQSDQFVEEEARNKLGMAREGEQVVILPNSAKIGEERKQDQKKLENWQKWMALLFN